MICRVAKGKGQRPLARAGSSRTAAMGFGPLGPRASGNWKLGYRKSLHRSCVKKAHGFGCRVAGNTG